MIISILLIPKIHSVEHLEFEVRSAGTRFDYTARVLFFIATLDFRPVLGAADPYAAHSVGLL